MIPRSEENFVLTNSQKESDFTIMANAKTFALLSDKIYTYKIAAVVREIFCNAFDSMIDAGRADVPVTVTLPNSDHLYFEVEDTGLGMDDECVRSVYTVFGMSTKLESNDVIGAMGIGSKSPFAYTKTFTITARKDGIELIYNAYLGNDGSPKINLVSKARTEERNGVKLTIPVREHDIGQFRVECQFILSFFSPRPIVISNEDFKFTYSEDVTNLSETQLTFASKNASHYISSELYQSDLYAVMGGVCYRITANDLPENTAKTLRLLSEGKHIFLKFPMGSLDFASSREQLSMDETTKKNLITGFENAVRGTLKDLQDKLDVAESTIEALDTFNEHFQIVKITRDFDYLLETFNYKGKSIKDLLFHKLNFMQIYDGEMIYRTDEGWSGRRRLNRTTKLDMFVVLKASKIKVVYVTDGHTRRGIHAAKEECNRKEHVIFFSKPIKQSLLDRIEKIVGSKRLELIDLKDWRIKNRVERVVSNKVAKAQLNNSEIYARSFYYHADNKNRVYVATEKHNLHNDNVFWIADGDQLTTLSEADIKCICAILTLKHFTVIVENTRNSKKLREFPDNNLTTVVEKEITRNKDVILGYSLHNHFLTTVYNGSTRRNHNVLNFLYEMLREAESDIVDKPAIDTVVDRFVGKPRDETLVIVDSLLSYSVNECIRNWLKPIQIEAQKMIATIDNEIKNKYPLLLCLQYDKKSIEYKSQVMSYIEMCDKLRELKSDEEV